MGLRRAELDDLRAAALLHHLGHLCLDAPEVREHPIEPFEVADKGAEILRQTDLAHAGDLLATDAVTVGGQILRLASAYDDLREEPRRRTRRSTRSPPDPGSSTTAECSTPSSAWSPPTPSADGSRRSISSAAVRSMHARCGRDGAARREPTYASSTMPTASTMSPIGDRGVDRVAEHDLVGEEHGDVRVAGRPVLHRRLARDAVGDLVGHARGSARSRPRSSAMPRPISSMPRGAEVATRRTRAARRRTRGGSRRRRRRTGRGARSTTSSSDLEREPDGEQPARAGTAPRRAG